MDQFRAFLVLLPAAAISRLRENNWRTVYPLVAVSILASIALCMGEGYYNGKWEALLTAMIILLGVELYRRFGLAACAMVSYLLGSGIWILEYGNRYSSLNPYDLLGIRYFTAQSVFKLILMITPFLLVRINRLEMRDLGRYASLAFLIISLLQIAWEWVRIGCAGVNTCGGALSNPSLNAAMLVVCLPLAAALITYGELLIIPILVAAMLGKSSIGIGMCAIWLVLLCWKRLSPSILFLGVTLIFALGKITHGNKDFFNSSGRFQMWKFFMGLWIKNPKNWLFGTGFGTFGVFSTNLQQAFNMNATDWWIWIHNDWLQMCFECGVVGLALMLWLYVTCAWKLRKEAPEMQSLLLFGVMMGCNYPLHIAPCCLYAAWIAAFSLIKPQGPAPIFSDQ